MGKSLVSKPQQAPAPGVGQPVAIFPQTAWLDVVWRGCDMPKAEVTSLPTEKCTKSKH